VRLVKRVDPDRRRPLVNGLFQSNCQTKINVSEDGGSTGRSIEIRLFDKGLAEVGPKKAGPAEVGPAEVGPAEVGPAEVGPAEVGPAEAAPLRSAKLRSAKLRSAMLRSAPRKRSKRSALRRWASRKVAPLRLAPWRLAPWRLAQWSSASQRSSPAKFRSPAAYRPSKSSTLLSLVLAMVDPDIRTASRRKTDRPVTDRRPRRNPRSWPGRGANGEWSSPSHGAASTIPQAGGCLGIISCACDT
jgi:hypothetical protein